MGSPLRLVLPAALLLAAAGPATAQIFSEEDYEAEAKRVVPRDAFPVLTDPELASAEEAAEELDAAEPVIGVALGGEARAYPVSMMGRVELVNDRCGDVPIAVSW